jgi:hypothetical protein
VAANAGSVPISIIRRSRSPEIVETPAFAPESESS